MYFASFFIMVLEIDHILINNFLLKMQSHVDVSNVNTSANAEDETNFHEDDGEDIEDYIDEVSFRFLAQSYRFMTALILLIPLIFLVKYSMDLDRISLYKFTNFDI